MNSISPKFSEQQSPVPLWFLQILDFSKTIRHITFEYLDEEEIYILSSFEDKESQYLKNYTFKNERYIFPRTLSFGIIVRIRCLQRMIFKLAEMATNIIDERRLSPINPWRIKKGNPILWSDPLHDLANSKNSIEYLCKTMKLLREIFYNMKAINDIRTDDLNSGTIADFEHKVIDCIKKIKRDRLLLDSIINKNIKWSEKSYQNNYINQFIFKLLLSNQPTANNVQSENCKCIKPSVKDVRTVNEDELIFVMDD